MCRELRKSVLCGAAWLCLGGYAEAQTPSQTNTQKASPRAENRSDSASALLQAKGAILKDFHLNLLLRNAIEIPKGSETAQIKTNETRMELTGKIKPSLSFRVRFRLNRSLTPRSSDNSSGGMD